MNSRFINICLSVLVSGMFMSMITGCGSDSANGGSGGKTEKEINQELEDDTKVSGTFNITFDGDDFTWTSEKTTSGNYVFNDSMVTVFSNGSVGISAQSFNSNRRKDNTLYFTWNFKNFATSPHYENSITFIKDGVEHHAVMQMVKQGETVNFGHYTHESEGKRYMHKEYEIFITKKSDTNGHYLKGEFELYVTDDKLNDFTGKHMHVSFEFTAHDKDTVYQ